jgi:dihydroorotase-like cyclic amidohydrolase
VDVGFWGMALPSNVGTPDLRSVLHHGALGLTATVATSTEVSDGLSPGGGADGGMRALTMAELEQVIDVASAVDKPVLVHAEVVSDDDAGLPAGADGMDYASWVAMRPIRWEAGAVRALLSMAAKPRQHAPRLHLMRLTDAGCTPMLAEASSSMAVSVEGVITPRVT